MYHLIFLLFGGSKTDINNSIQKNDYIESKINDIKATNQFIIEL